MYGFHVARDQKTELVNLPADFQQIGRKDPHPGLITTEQLFLSMLIVSQFPQEEKMIVQPKQSSPFLKEGDT